MLTVAEKLVTAIHSVTQRSESAQADVQRHAGNLNPTRGDLFEHLWRRVQPGSRLCNGSTLSRKHRLVEVAIGR